MSVYYEFEEVDAFTSGAIGRPGSRVFYLQARIDDRRITVRCEKQQVAAIAEYLRRVMVDLPPPEDRPMGGAGDLGTPVEEIFVLGSVGLGYDRSSDRIVLQLEEMIIGADPDDSPDEFDEADRGQMRVYVTRAQAAAFCDRADEVVAAGRPTCRWCDQPMDPDGHPCPRMN